MDPFLKQRSGHQRRIQRHYVLLTVAVVGVRVWQTESERMKVREKGNEKKRARERRREGCGMFVRKLILLIRFRR